MKDAKTEIVVALFAILVSCCAGRGTAPDNPPAEPPLDAQPSSNTNIEIDQPFELAFGKTRELDEPIDGQLLTVTFEAIVGDSRCPRDVTCVWAGDAEITVRVALGSSTTSASLHTNSAARFQREARVFDLVLGLEHLEPYPQSAGRIETADYVATLVLRTGPTESSTNSQ